MTRVAFRADAGAVLGSGHVMRCLTLADALRARGAECRFLCRQQPGHLGELIDRRGYPVDWLPAGIDADEDACLSRESLKDGTDWLVVDHYGLDAAWEQALASSTGKLLVIDDLADRPHACQVLLDQNGFTDPTARYAALLPEGCRALFGPRHALLNPRFAELARPCLDRGKPVGRVLVFLGGADPANFTGRVLSRLDNYPTLAVDVVAGHAHPARPSLEAWCGERPGFRLHPPGEGFPDLMAAADIAIGAGGTTTWERCCLGLPSLVLGIADNQYQVAQAVAESGAHLYLGPAEQVSDRQLGGALDTLLAQAGLRRHLAERGRALVDGNGVERVADILLPRQKLALRPAQATDLDLIFRWRNDPNTRRYFFDPHPLDHAEHVAWFTRLLADPDRVLLIGLDGERPLGAIRYDIQGEVADISVFLDPEAQGRGLGVRLLHAGSHWLAEHRPGLRHLEARIHPDNRASLAAFAAAGFAEHNRHYRYTL